MRIFTRNRWATASGGVSPDSPPTRPFVTLIVITLFSVLPGQRSADALDCTRAVTATEQLLCRERGRSAGAAGDAQGRETPPAKPSETPDMPRVFSAGDVWYPHDTSAWLGTLIQCDWKDPCVSNAMVAAGASPGAIAIARAQRFNGYLSEFEESGHVDIGRVRLEYTARPGTACYALNGTPPAIDLGAELAQDAELKAAIRAHPLFNSLQWRYQDAHPEYRGAFHILPHQVSACTASGSAQGQELHVELGMGGCEECEPGGHAQFVVDIDRNGALVAKRVLELNETPRARWAPATANAPSARQLRFPDARPAVQSRQDVGPEPLQRLLRRVTAEKALEKEGGDACELATLRALGAADGSPAAARDRRALAAEILRSAQGNAATESGVGDFLLALGSHAADSTLPGVAVSAALTRGIAEEIGGYVAAKAVAEYLAGASGGMDEALVNRLLRDDGLSVWTMNGTDTAARTQRAADAPGASVTAQLYYNPYTRYISAVAGSSCTGAGGGTDRRLYRLHYEVVADAAQSADYVPGTVVWREIIAGP